MPAIDASTPTFLEVHNGFYGREVTEWLKRAEPADKERFARVFEDLQNVTIKNHPAPDAAAIAQMEAIKAIISRKTMTSTTSVKPPKPGGETQQLGALITCAHGRSQYHGTQTVACCMRKHACRSRAMLQSELRSSMLTKGA